MVISDDECLALLMLKKLIKSGNPDMDDFLYWIEARLEKVHLEDPNIDYIQALQRYADGIADIKRVLWK